MTRIALALAAALAATPAAAAEFTIFIYETPADIALRTDAGDEGGRYWAAYGEYAAMLGRDGVIRGGAPLDPAGAASDGGLVLGGYMIIDVPTDADAARYAAAAPAAVRGGEARAVRHYPAPAMAAPTD